MFSFSPSGDSQVFVCVCVCLECRASSCARRPFVWLSVTPAGARRLPSTASSWAPWPWTQVRGHVTRRVACEDQKRPLARHPLPARLPLGVRISVPNPKARPSIARRRGGGQSGRKKAVQETKSLEGRVGGRPRPSHRLADWFSADLFKYAVHLNLRRRGTTRPKSGAFYAVSRARRGLCL